MLINYFIGQLTGQWSFVIHKLQKRFVLICKIMWLSFLRAKKLFNFLDLFLYVIWLCSDLGWRRYQVKFFRYYRGISEFVIRNSLLLIFLIFMISKINFKIYCNFIFNIFSNPVLTEKGYLPFAIVISCSLVWFILLISVLYFKSLRNLLKPYISKIIILNLVVFILLMTLFTKVGRAKFGIRVWYPTDRTYGNRLGFEFWD